MKKLKWLIARAEHSTFYLWLLNFAAARFVPFNKPHSFAIRHISNELVELELPYKKSNMNHIRGIHACALATLCEYCTGIVLWTALDASSYRFILKNIHMTYHYQAKANVIAKFEMNKEWIEKNITSQMKNNEAFFTELTVDVYDTGNNHICTALINWQIKSWSNVKMVMGNG